jgi:hypothetical protein
MRDLPQAIRQAKLKRLAEVEGHNTTAELLARSTFDSVVLAICTNPDCDYTAEMEPDQGTGWCEMCESNTVASGLILAGFI